MDGLLAPVEEALGDATPEDTHLLRLVRGIHGEVGTLPVAEDAEPLELRALDGDVAPRVGAAALADLGPAPEDLRLALGEVGAHREFGARQVERLPVVHRGGRPP